MARIMADKFLLTILGTLNEAQARWYVAREAIALGRGGIKAMQELTRLSKPTILRGIRELKTEDLPPPDRVRKSGGGRKRLEQSDSAEGIKARLLSPWIYSAETAAISATGHPRRCLARRRCPEQL